MVESCQGFTNCQIKVRMVAAGLATTSTSHLRGGSLLSRWKNIKIHEV